MELDFSNETIEKLLTKRVLQDKHWLTILSNVTDSLFGKSRNKDRKSLFRDPRLKIVTNVALKYFRKYNQVPSSKIIHLLVKKYDELHPGEIVPADVQGLLMDIQSLDQTIPDDVLSGNFKEFIKKQAMIETLSENAELLTSDNGDYQKVVDLCLANFEKVQKITFNDTDLGMEYFNETAMQEHWEFLKNPSAKIQTGWSSVDAATNGGFLKDGRMLALIMAQAGLGKSAFLSNLAVNFLRQDLSVVVITLEMSQDVYAARFDAHISKKNINRLAENSVEAIARLKEFYAAHPHGNLFIKEFAPRSIRSRDIESYLENLRNAGHTFDVLIVDYLGLVLPNHSQDSMYKDGQMVSEELRKLSYTFQIPVISAVQCNSEGMNSETVDMQNIAESKAIAHTVDFLSVLTRTPEQRENGIVSMRILKNRFGGQVGKVSNFKFNDDTLELADITYDPNAEVEPESTSILSKFLKNKSSMQLEVNEL